MGRSADACGRLGLFQKLMYQWGELHPFNAVHIFKICGPLRADVLNSALSRTYRQLGLGWVEVAADACRYRYEMDGDVALEVVSGGEDPEQTLASHVTRQLNRPFARPRCQPIRVSVVTSERGEFHYLNVTYDHWIADSMGIRLVLRQVLAAYCGLEPPDTGAAVELYPVTYRQAFADRLGGVRAAGSVLRWAGGWMRNRGAAQVAYSSASQMATNYDLYWTDPETVPRLVQFARKLDVTVNDVVLAALARTMSVFLPRGRRGKRRELVLGNIVDARGDALGNLDDALGAYLAYYGVRCRRDESVGLAELAQRIAAVTGPIKVRRRYLDSAVGMKLISAIWPHLSPTVKPRFARWALPMTASVSNVLVRDPWLLRYGRGVIMDYCRAGSVGPSVPLLVAPTTWDHRMSVGVTYRVTGFPRAKIAGIVGMLLEQFERPERADAKRRIDAGHDMPTRRMRRWRRFFRSRTRRSAPSEF